MSPWSSFFFNCHCPTCHLHHLQNGLWKWPIKWSSCDHSVLWSVLHTGQGFASAAPWARKVPLSCLHSVKFSSAVGLTSTVISSWKPSQLSKMPHMYKLIALFTCCHFSLCCIPGVDVSSLSMWPGRWSLL